MKWGRLGDWGKPGAAVNRAPKLRTFQQRCHHEDCCANWMYMLTVHSSPVSFPPSPLLKSIPNTRPVGLFAQYLRDMLNVVYSHVRCGFCNKFNNRKPSGWTRLYFGREARKRDHTWHDFEHGRLIGVSWGGGCRLVIPVLVSCTIFLCHDLCKNRQEMYASNNNRWE